MKGFLLSMEMDAEPIIFRFKNDGTDCTTFCFIPQEEKWHTAKFYRRI